jgi:hypothetical protein
MRRAAQRYEYMPCGYAAFSGPIRCLWQTVIDCTILVLEAYENEKTRYPIYTDRIRSASARPAD